MRAREEDGGHSSPVDAADPGSSAADPSSSVLVVAAIVCPIMLLVGVALGAAIGDLLIPSDPLNLFPAVAESDYNAPEPAEFARFLLAALIPVLVIAGVFLAARRPTNRWLGATARASWMVVPALILLLAALSWFGRTYEDPEHKATFEYFRGGDGLVALGFAALAIGALASGRLRGRLRGLLSARFLIWLAPVLVGVLIVVFLLPVVQTNQSFRASVSPFVGFHYVSTLADFEAVANGSSPGVDYAPEYASVLAYLLTPLFQLVDFQPGAVVDILAAVSGLILFAFYRVLWLTTGSAANAALLFVPVLGLSFVPAGDALGLPINNTNAFQILPIRYAGPAVVALLLACHLARGWESRGRIAIFFAATLAAISTPDFGIASMIGSAFALLVLAIGEDTRWRQIKLLARDAAIGAVAAVALFTVFSLLRTGEAPSVSLLLYFARVFASRGFGLIPMDTMGLHWLLYLTFASGMVLAGVRSLSREKDRLLTGALGFFSSFGLAAGVYYVGRSNQYTLISIFPLWGMTLALLGWIVLRDIARRPGLTSVAPGMWVLRALVLFCLGVGVASATRAHRPWHEVDRINTSNDGADQLDVGPEAGLVASRTVPGEKTAILCRSAYRIADQAGVRNVSPIADPQNLISPDVVSLIADQLEDEGGAKLFSCDAGLIASSREIERNLEQLGFSRSGPAVKLDTGQEYVTFDPDIPLRVQEWAAPSAGS